MDRSAEKQIYLCNQVYISKTIRQSYDIFILHLNNMFKIFILRCGGICNGPILPHYLSNHTASVTPITLFILLSTCYWKFTKKGRKDFNAPSRVTFLFLNLLFQNASLFCWLWEAVCFNSHNLKDKFCFKTFEINSTR